MFQGILAGEYRFSVEKTNFDVSTVKSQIDEGEDHQLLVELKKNISEEPNSPIVEVQEEKGDVPLYYGLLPSALIFMILIVLYTTINGINKQR